MRTDNEFLRCDELQWGGLRLWQDTRLFCFGTDAVLLSHFADTSGAVTFADFGCASGILTVLAAGKNPLAHGYAIDVQQPLCELAQRNVRENGLEGRVRVVPGDIKEAHALLPPCDVVLCNPPYERMGSGLLPAGECARIARFEYLCTFEDIARSAARVLKTGGRFYCIHRAQRLTGVLSALEANGVAPALLRFVYAAEGENARFVLLCARKGGGEGVRVLPPLVLYSADGRYTAEVAEMYRAFPAAEE